MMGRTGKSQVVIGLLLADMDPSREVHMDLCEINW